MENDSQSLNFFLVGINWFVFARRGWSVKLLVPSLTSFFLSAFHALCSR